MSRNVLITGFDPFDSEPINASFEAVKALPDEIDGAKIHKVELPTVFSKSAFVAIEAIEEYKPDIVLLTGQSGGSTAVSIERVAINIDDARIPDNEENRPVDVPIIEGDSPAYFSTLPIKKIVASLKEDGIPAVVSNSAGTFVCNHVMYAVLSHIRKRRLGIRSGFIHVPYIPEQAIEQTSRPSMSLSMMTRALQTITQTCLFEFRGEQKKIMPHT